MKGYICLYSTGEYDDYHKVIVFFTSDKKIAKKWCSKFNKILKKWKEYYSQFSDKDDSIKWIKPEYIEQHFDRWYQVNNINNSWFEEIEIR